MDGETFECLSMNMWYWEGVEDWAPLQEKENSLLTEMASLRSAVEMVKDVVVARQEAAGEGAVAREAAAQESQQPGTVGQAKDVVEPSAPEMEERRFMNRSGGSPAGVEGIGPSSVGTPPG